MKIREILRKNMGSNFMNGECVTSCRVCCEESKCKKIEKEILDEFEKQRRNETKR